MSNTKFDSPLGAKISTIIYDCPSSQALAEFYGQLLGGEIMVDEQGTCGLITPALSVPLIFQEEGEDYLRPLWPTTNSSQQQQAHLDIKVNNRKQAIDFAIKLGATWPTEQFCQPEWEYQWTTLLDPAGHPFCLFE